MTHCYQLLQSTVRPGGTTMSCTVLAPAPDARQLNTEIKLQTAPVNYQSKWKINHFVLTFWQFLVKRMVFWLL